MSKNMGMIDRILRSLLSLVLLYFALLSGIALFEDVLIKGGVIVVSLVLLLTSGISFCPLYSLFGIKTCKVCQK